MSYESRRTKINKVLTDWNARLEGTHGNYIICGYSKINELEINFAIPTKYSMRGILKDIHIFEKIWLETAEKEEKKFKQYVSN